MLTYLIVTEPKPYWYLNAYMLDFLHYRLPYEAVRRNPLTKQTKILE